MRLQGLFKNCVNLRRYLGHTGSWVNACCYPYYPKIWPLRSTPPIVEETEAQSLEGSGFKSKDSIVTSPLDGLPVSWLALRLHLPAIQKTSSWPPPGFCSFFLIAKQGHYLKMSLKQWGPGLHSAASIQTHWLGWLTPSRSPGRTQQ